MAVQQEQFLAVLKASYGYDPQSDDEIAIKEDQLLLLKERVDEELVSFLPSPSLLTGSFQQLVEG